MNYLTLQNNPENKNKSIKENVHKLIEKIQKKPELEPASTKALDLLMQKVYI